MRARWRTVAAAVCGVGLLLGSAACSDDEGGSVTRLTDPTVPLAGREAVAESLVATVIEPAYQNLATATADLAAAAEALCVDPSDPAALEAARAAWLDASRAWATTRPVRLGPLMDLRVGSDISYAVDPDKIATLLAGTDPVTAEALDSSGADRRTLGGIEVVLFGPEPMDARRCEYVLSASSLVADAAVSVADAWAAGPDLSPQDVVDGAVNGIVFTLSAIGEMQLGEASGAVTGTPDFATVDAGPSQTALDDMLAELDAVDRLLEGGGDDGHGIASLVREQSPEAADRVTAEVDAARAAVESVPPPLARTDDLAPVTAAYEAVLVPLTTMRAEVASLLGVTLNFSDTDGDS